MSLEQFLFLSICQGEKSLLDFAIRYAWNIFLLLVYHVPFGFMWEGDPLLLFLIPVFCGYASNFYNTQVFELSMKCIHFAPYSGVVFCILRFINEGNWNSVCQMPRKLLNFKPMTHIVNTRWHSRLWYKNKVGQISLTRSAICFTNRQQHSFLFYVRAT